MKYAQWMLLASAIAFAAGLLGVLAGTNAQWGRILPYLMWDHAVVILVCIAAGYKLKKMVATGAPKLSALFPAWLIAAGIVAVVAAAPNWAQMYRTSTSHEESGVSPWTSGVGFWSKGGKYYARARGEPEHEITESQYEELQQGVFTFFARGWVAFGLVALFLWNLILQRQRATQGATPSPATTPTPASIASEPRVSTRLIVAIWGVVLLSSFTQLLSPALPMMCTVPFSPPLVVLMPFVVFGIGAFFAKRSPFYSPWVAQMVDAKYGALTFETFLQKLRPVLLFGFATLAISGVSFVHCSAVSGAAPRPGMVETFFFAAGISFFLMHFILRYRKVPGV